MGWFQNFFSHSDFFGRPVRLSIDKNDSVKTVVGGFFTLAALTLTLVLSSRTISNYLNHKNPTLQFDYNFFDDPGMLLLNSSNFLFSITNQASSYNLSSANLNFKLWYAIYTRDANGTVSQNWTQIPMVKCTREYWKGFETEYDAQNMKNRLCPSSMLYDISGTFLANEYRFLSIEVIKCQNMSIQPDVICKTPTDLNASLSSVTDLTISFMYTDNIFNLNEWENPVKRFVTNLHYNIVPGVFAKKVDVYASQYDIITDDSYFMGGYSQKNYSTYQINGVEREQNFAPIAYGGQEKYMNLYFRKGSTYTTVTRVFLKAVDVFGALGGLFGFWFPVFGLIAILYNKRALDVKIANSLYEFENNYDSQTPRDETGEDGSDRRKRCWRCCPRKKKEKADLRSELSVKTDSPITLKGRNNLPKNRGSVFSFGTQKPNTSDRMKLYVKSFQNYSKGFGKKMSFNFLDFLANIFLCGKRKKDQVINIAVKRIQEDTDITHLLKRIQELEKLKLLFFNEHQRRIFSYSRPPLISLEDENLAKLSIPQTQKKLEKNTSPKNRKKGFFRNSIMKYKDKRKKTMLSRDETDMDLDSVNKFAFVVDSYRKIRRAKGRMNKELLQLLDLEIEQILYNLDYELKVDNAFSAEYFNIAAIRIFEDLFFKAKRKKKIMTKEDAATIISRRWLLTKKKRRMGDIRKLTKVKTIFSGYGLKSQQQLQKKTGSTNQSRLKRFDVNSMDREDNEFDDNFIENEVFGENNENGDSAQTKSMDFDDDEILNDFYNYSEDINDLQVPGALQNKSKHRLVELTNSSHRGLADDQRADAQTSKLKSPTNLQVSQKPSLYFLKSSMKESSKPPIS